MLIRGDGSWIPSAAIVAVSFLLTTPLTSLAATAPMMVQFDGDTLTLNESQTLSYVNGTRAWQFGLELEEIALRNHAYRSAGSKGANESADFILAEFEDLNLDSWRESFEFMAWDLRSKPQIILDKDGDFTTLADQYSMISFQPEHWSWHTPDGGVIARTVMLPLPVAASRSSTGLLAIDNDDWDAVDTTGAVLFIGREVRWDQNWEREFVEKITRETPAAIVYVWWYDWMGWIDSMFYSSVGGMPHGYIVDYLRSLHIPIGSVNFSDGAIAKTLVGSGNLSASVSIESIMTAGVHYNILARMEGSIESDSLVLVTGHYDTVMSAGFCDNGAGVAGVLEVATSLARARQEGIFLPRYTFLFIALSAEELGLIGSINYVSDHIDDIPRVVAVLNLDCIGNDVLVVSETNPAGELDLDQVVIASARDLDVGAVLRPTITSDHEVFRNPIAIEASHSRNWGASAGLSTASSVAASLTLSSSPVSFTDLWTEGSPGWIHTSRDSSDFCSSGSWIDEGDLESHIKVAVLSLTRIGSHIPQEKSADMILTCAGIVLVVTAVAATLILLSHRMK